MAQRQAEYSALDLFDMARGGESGFTHWLPWMGTTLGVSLEGDGLVYVWAADSPEDTDDQFDVHDIDETDFEAGLDDVAEAGAEA